MGWENRNEYKFKLFQGVYVIAVTNKRLEGEKVTWNDVVYIGMTNSLGGLSNRWRQFDRAINGKFGHSGGKTIYEDLGPYYKWKKNLFVAAMGIECNVKNPKDEDYIRMGWVAFYEYEAFSMFFRNTGEHPKYNKQ
jgi:hypothetical protein